MLDNETKLLKREDYLEKNIDLEFRLNSFQLELIAVPQNEVF